MAMRTIRSVQTMRRLAEKLRREGKTIGFVPTMGALHDGHLSLMREAGRKCDVVVASIFVNPAQFGPNEDYERYPRDPHGDAQKCRTAGVDCLFVPTAEQIYPAGDRTRVAVERLGELLEGASRPGHFAGVATVVAKLFHIVRPDRAYFGLKDYQQWVLIRRMAKDLDFGVEVVGRPTLREADGLAMSSRNRYLSPEERKSARVLWKALQEGKALLQQGERRSAKIRERMIKTLRLEPHAKIDYVAVADPENLEAVSEIRKPVVFLLAVWIGKTRLIDNLPAGRFN